MKDDLIIDIYHLISVSGANTVNEVISILLTFTTSHVSCNFATVSVGGHPALVFQYSFSLCIYLSPSNSLSFFFYLPSLFTFNTYFLPPKHT